MSKLGDKIRKASRLEQAAIGFGTSRATHESTMVLLGAARDAAAAEQLRAKGADAVIIGTTDAPAPGSAPAGASDAITGGWIGASGDAKALKAGGYDFVIFDPDRTPSTAVLEESVGYVLALPADIGELELRTIESFQLDAIYAGAVDAALTVRKQIELRRIFGLTRKPLMASVPASIEGPQLQALRDTNVIAVLAASSEDVAKLRATIDALPPRARRKDEDRPTPLVPRASAGEEEHDHDHDD